MLLNGGVGQFKLGRLATTQFSLGNLIVSGSLAMDSEPRQVEGRGWLDRQWIASGQSGDIGSTFDWLGFCLDNGDTVSLWDASMRAEDPRTWVTIGRGDGTHIVTMAESLARTAADVHRTPSGGESRAGGLS